MTYLFAAYTVVWLGVLGYALWVSQKQRRLQMEVEALEAALRIQGGPGAAGAGTEGSAKGR